MVKVFKPVAIQPKNLNLPLKQNNYAGFIERLWRNGTPVFATERVNTANVTIYTVPAGYYLLLTNLNLNAYSSGGGATAADVIYVTINSVGFSNVLNALEFGDTGVEVSATNNMNFTPPLIIPQGSIIRGSEGIPFVVADVSIVGFLVRNEDFLEG